MSRSPLPRALVGVTSLAVLIATAGTLPASAAGPAGVYGGSAYGSSVSVQPLTLGRSSAVSMCTTKAGATASANAAGVEVPGLGTIGAVTTKVSASRSTRPQTTTTVSRTAGVDLLGGLIRASAITTEAKASRSSSTYTRTGKTTLTGLTVAGIPVSVQPSKNAAITIPDVAKVTLNEQTTKTSYGSRSITVVGLRVQVLTGNPLGLPTGTIVVGSAKASIHSPVHNRPYGWAYGTQVDVGSVIKSGPTAAVYLPCGGSGGASLGNSVAGADLPGVVDVGAVKTRATSTDTKKKSTATTSATVAGVDLLGGVVTVEAITVKATAVRKGSKLDRSSAGSKVAGLKINGKAYSVGTAANTRIDIPGVGSLVLRRVAKSSTGLTVNAIQLKLGVARSGLAAGTVITVGAANAGVSRH